MDLKNGFTYGKPPTFSIGFNILLFNKICNKNPNWLISFVIWPFPTTGDWPLLFLSFIRQSAFVSSEPRTSVLRFRVEQQCPEWRAARSGAAHGRRAEFCGVVSGERFWFLSKGVASESRQLQRLCSQNHSTDSTLELELYLYTHCFCVKNCNFSIFSLSRRRWYQLGINEL